MTGCAVAIAEPGTIVLDGGQTQERRVLSLLPDYHLCIIDAEQVVALIPEAVAALGAAIEEKKPPTFISGSSATSDIELTRAEGVHGPRRLEVLLVGGNAPSTCRLIASHVNRQDLMDWSIRCHV